MDVYPLLADNALIFTWLCDWFQVRPPIRDRCRSVLSAHGPQERIRRRGGQRDRGASDGQLDLGQRNPLQRDLPLQEGLGSHSVGRVQRPRSVHYRPQRLPGRAQRALH